MNEDRRRQQAVLVLGMHRSGTSAATRVLNLLGAELNSEMLAAAPDNPKGFWEGAEAVQLHERLFAALSRTWYDMHALPADWMSHPAAREAVKEIVGLVQRDFEGKRLWAIKDPRMCLFVPLWLEALASLDIDVKALFVARNPVEVSASLRVRNMRERNQWGLGYAPVMWAQYLAAAEEATRTIPRAMLTYDELLSSWRTVMARVSDDLDIAWPRGFEETGAEIDAFLDQGARHHHVAFDAAEALRVGVPDLVVRMYEECLTITRRRTDWHGLAPMVAEYFAAAGFYSGALDNFLGHYQVLEERAAEYESSSAHVQAVVEIRDKELAEYQRQAKEYDDLLSVANAQNETVKAMLAALTESSEAQVAAFQRDLAEYEEQAQRYDALLREANARIDSLSRQIQEQASTFEQARGAYHEQARTYDDLLREANARIESLDRQIQEQAAVFERSRGAYHEQAQGYDDQLREANGRIGSLTGQLQEQVAAFEEEQTAHSERVAAFKNEQLAYEEQATVFMRDLEAYRKQAQIYDDLLREANDRIASLSRQLQEQSGNA